MVRKLLKYDLSSLLRTIIPINIVLIAMALFVKVMQVIEIDNKYYESLVSAVHGSYYLLAFVCCMLNGLIIVIRFYKNLFTSEGYMSFTLPVTTTQHIASKYISSLIVTAITGLTVLITDFIVNFDYSITYLYADGIGYAIDNNNADNIVTAILLFILLIVFIMQAYLIVFACISLGQSMPGNRIAVSIGLFFAYFFATFIAKITILITLFFNDDFYFALRTIIEKFITFMTPGNTILLLYIIFKIGMGVIYYIINYYIIEKRLNLE